MSVETASGPSRRVDGTLMQAGMAAGRAPWVGGGVVAVVAVVALIVGLGAVGSKSSSQTRSPAAGNLASCPAAGHLANTANGAVRSNILEPDNYAFLFVNNGCAPVRFNPCQPVHYAVDTTLATPANLADLRQAITMLGQATGMTFVSDGFATDAAGLASIYATAKAEGRWAPIGIDWRHLGPGTDQSETVGEGRPDVVDGVIVTGGITYNADAHLLKAAPVPDGFGAGVSWGRILLHELGHVVGLGHVTNPDEVMHEPITDPSSATNSDYGIGDLAGLRLLGRSAGCEAVPAVRSLR